MKSVGVDIAKDSAHFAYREWFCGQWRWRVAVAHPEDTDALRRVLGGAWAAGCELVAIERPYLGKHNPHTFQVLSGVFMRVQVVAEAFKMRVVGPMPSQWRQAITWAGHLPTTRKELKALAIRVAEAEGAKVDGDDNAADAVCICVWAERAGEELLK